MNLNQIATNEKLKSILLELVQWKDGSEFDILCDYYKVTQTSSGIKAKTTGIPYIIHILEGLLWLDHKMCGVIQKRAFILHPVLQNDYDIQNNYNRYNYDSLPNKVLILTMEYRKQANSYLPKTAETSLFDPETSALRQVNPLLAADKLQNQKDYYSNIQKHYDVRGKGECQNLEFYFSQWFKVLGLTEMDEKTFKALCLEHLGWEVWQNR